MSHPLQYTLHPSTIYQCKAWKSILHNEIHVWIFSSGTLCPVSFCTGGVGVVCGLVVAKRRKVPLHVHSVSLGANFAVVTALFLGLRQTTQNMANQLGYETDQRRLEYLSSSLSGGITGVTSSIVSR